MRAPAKINIFLKIVGTRGDYHELLSRFIRYDVLYDELEFIEGDFKEFEIFGMDIPKKSNIIYKAYQSLCKHFPNLPSFFQHYAIKITKKIPQGAGLGGGSSDAATFLKMTNQKAKLGLSTQELAALAAEIGADVPFFIYDYPAANVSGIGEVIEPFEDEVGPLELKLLPIHCDTALVYRNWRKHHLHFDKALAEQLLSMTSKEILATIAPQKANDLYQSAKELCKELKNYPEWFLSGSGSTLFRSKDEGHSHQ